MTCSKARVAFRPLVENLESRLQPGSLVLGQGYGWSLLAHDLSILQQGSLDSQRLISQSPSENSKPARTVIPADTHSDHQDTAVVRATAPHGDTLPLAKLVDNVAASLSNDDLGL